MKTYDNPGKASEKKFVLEAQQEFKAESRRNKKLAVWVGELLGKSEKETKSYVTEVIMADMEEAGDEDVFRKIRADLDAANLDISDTVLRDRMRLLMEEAREEIAAEAGLL
ncbi:MAG: DUF1476 domain-containing protein [Hyphomonadaceae bacterium]|nr:DUF1476 domain-containing protein [Hyphomonadaceae bacterium]MBC6412085.1 DUF1476 domain-containing protein [Hyphomonadaceae bacterium]